MPCIITFSLKLSQVLINIAGRILAQTFCGSPISGRWPPQGHQPICAGKTSKPIVLTTPEKLLSMCGRERQSHVPLATLSCHSARLAALALQLSEIQATQPNCYKHELWFCHQPCCFAVDTNREFLQEQDDFDSFVSYVEAPNQLTIDMFFTSGQSVTEEGCEAAVAHEGFTRLMQVCLPPSFLACKDSGDHQATLVEA